MSKQQQDNSALGDKVALAEKKTPLASSKDQAEVVYVTSPTSRWIHRNRFIVLLLMLAAVISFDQWTKLSVRDSLARPLPADKAGVVHYRGTHDYAVIPGIFHLRYVENPAAAFSLTRSIPKKYRMPMLITISYFAMALLLFWIVRLKVPDGMLVIGFSMILSGAIGNAIDRNMHSYVIDFIDWRLTRFFPSWPPWPTFNIADSAIVVGAGFIYFRSLFPLKELNSEQNKANNTSANEKVNPSSTGKSEAESVVA